MALRLGNLDESVRWMEEALTVFDNEDQEMKQARDEMLLIKVRYFSHFASVHYIKGDFKSSKSYIDRAIEICSDELNYTYETAESFKKQLPELQTMQVKCEAKLLGISSIELKKRAASSAGTVAVSSTPLSKNLVPLVSIFGLFSTTGFLLAYNLMKLKN